MIDLSPLDRHERVALSCSGGKDSLACAYLLLPFADRITVYHLDTGDLLPEVVETVDHIRGLFPHFVHVRSDSMGWIAEHGMPTDLLPHSAHDVGRRMGEERTRLVSRYDCCFANLMWPLYERIRADGNTLLIRGTKRVDMAQVPFGSGQVVDGIEHWLPVEAWSNDDVFAYLSSVGAPICRIYSHVTNAPECARCSAWWGEKRAAYLKRYHPALFADYQERMRAVMRELQTPLTNLATEMTELGGMVDG